MSNKERIIQMLDTIPEYKTGYILAYIQGIAAGEDTETTDPFYTAENFERLERSVEQLKAGHGTSHELVEVE